jgi:hypothetical protein
MVVCMPYHHIQYKLYWINPVDYFDVVLQKQIDLRTKLEINENYIVVVKLTCDKRFSDSEFYKKYKTLFNNINDFGFSFLKLNSSQQKYTIIKTIYYELKEKQSEYAKMSLEEFEYKIDLMLEEFKLFLDKFEFNENEKKIIEAFTLDEKLKSNIKFIEWDDFYA